MARRTSEIRHPTYDKLTRWERERFAMDSQTLAAGLIGALLVRRLESGEILAGRIVETEAYLGARDRASHAFGGRRSERNRSMYMQPGTAYVYFTYGMHYCMNVVCGQVDEPAAVLVRALDPVIGIESMRRFRAGWRTRVGSAQPSHLAAHELCAGPARLCQALDINRTLDGLDLVEDPRLWLADAPSGAAGLPRVTRSPRIGVDYAGAWARRLLRWSVVDHPAVSHRPRKGSQSGRGKGARRRRGAADN